MKKENIVFKKDEKTLNLSIFLKFLIIFPLTNIFGIDRLILKEYKSFLLKLLYLITPFFLFFYIIDIIKLFKNKYRPDIKDYFEKQYSYKQLFFITFFYSNMFGIDRFIYGYKLAAFIRFLFGTLIIFGIVFYIIDMVKLFKNKYNQEEIL